MRLAPLALAVTGLLAACSAGPTATPTTSAPATAAIASPSPTPTPTPTPVRTSPLTGLPEEVARPVVVVKLDNTANAQPHAGLTAADVVYVEEVEYGITRLAALFASTVPDRIGPVRSARITDLDLLHQYGTPAFAYSGAQRKLLPAIADSPLIDVSPVRNARGYSRDRNRYAPYNLFVDGQAVVDQAPKATLDHDMGWVFTDEVPAGGRPTVRASMRWREARADFTYDEESGLYRVRFNGRRAAAEENDEGQNAATVIIQNVRQRPSVYFDRYGANTPHATTIGSGTATVLRDGQAWDVRWERPDAESGTRFVQADGTPLPFKPGQQWVVLLNERTPATIRAPKAASPSGSPTLPSPSGSVSKRT